MSDEMNPEDVRSRDDLVLFLEQMSRRAGTFDNQRLDVFLEAASGWLADADGYFTNRGEETPANASWALMAKILLAGTTYE